MVADIQERYRLRTLIVDQSPQVREHLISLVAHLETVELVGEVGEPGEAEAAVEALYPDVVIVDPTTPGGGPETIRRIRQLAPKTTIVMLAFYPHSRYRAEYEQAGADYVLDKLTEVKRVGEVLADIGNF